MSTGIAARFSTRELQAAADALAAGRFATSGGSTTTVAAGGSAVVVARGRTVEEGEASAPPVTGNLAAGLRPLVRVRAANAGRSRRSPQKLVASSGHAR